MWTNVTTKPKACSHTVNYKLRGHLSSPDHNISIEVFYFNKASIKPDIHAWICEFPTWLTDVNYYMSVVKLLSTFLKWLLKIQLLMHSLNIRALRLSTLWEPGCNIFVLWNQPKTNSCQLPYQRHSSSADCARELFKGSNGLASHLVRTQKTFFGWGLRIFCEWRHKWSSFWAILAHVTWPRAQPLGQSISLKFPLETSLESESFEPLIDFLAFLGQKLWSKINKLIN